MKKIILLGMFIFLLSCSFNSGLSNSKIENQEDVEKSLSKLKEFLNQSEPRKVIKLINRIENSKVKLSEEIKIDLIFHKNQALLFSIDPSFIEMELEKQLQIYPNSIKLNLLYAEILHQQKKTAAYKKSMETIIDIIISKPEFQNYSEKILSNTYTNIGASNPSEDVIGYAIVERKVDTELFYNYWYDLILQEKENKNNFQVLSMLKKLKKAGCKEASLSAELGNSYFKRKDFNQAKIFFKEYFEKTKKDTTSLLFFNSQMNYADLLYKKGHFKKSLKFFDAALKTLDEFENCLHEILDNSNKAKDKHTFADKWYYAKKKTQKKQLSIFKTNREYMLLLYAKAYSGLEDYKNAVKILNRLTALNPNHINAYYYKGYYLNGQQEYLAANRSFEKALSLNPGLTQLHYSIAVNYDRKELISKAKKHYKEFLNKNEKKHTNKYYRAKMRYKALK